MNYQPNKQVKNFQRGFTLMEILIVVLIVGVLAAVGIITLLTANAKSRDIQRLSDVRQVQNALELYFYNRNAFPIANNIILGGDDYKVLCDSASGFQSGGEECGKIFLNQLPAAPARTADDSYVYSSDGQTYSLIFVLEKAADGLEAGEHTATQNGVQ